MSGHEFMQVFAKVGAEMERRNLAWIEKLREAGFKAAHPNDGLVDRKHDQMTLSYPHFNDGAGVGDLVMLGCADRPETMRPVRLTGIRESVFFPSLVYWTFEPADVPFPNGKEG